MTLACPDCGTLQELPPPRRGDLVACRRCQMPLERLHGRSIDAALACGLAALLLLLPANVLPLFMVHFGGMTLQTRLSSGVWSLAQDGAVILAALCAAYAIVLPPIRFALLVSALGALRLGARPRWTGPVFRYAMVLDRWAMADVFLLGAAVGYGRIAARVPVAIGAGGFCFIAAALMAMMSRAVLDARTVWRAIAPPPPVPLGVPLISCTVCDAVVPIAQEGRGCPRCGLKLRARRPDAMVRTLALVLASALLLVPANLYPMSITDAIGHTLAYRIIDGVKDLFQAGLWPLGILICITSIGIPFLKLIGLSWFMLSTHRRSSRRLVAKTRLNRAIDEIGRWSCMDPFTIAVFIPMQFRDLIVSHAGIAATAFIVVVTLTMLATRLFDPRLMWDAALGGSHVGR